MNLTYHEKMVAGAIKNKGYRIVKLEDSFYCEECDVEEPIDCFHEAESNGDPVRGPFYIKEEV